LHTRLGVTLDTSDLAAYRAGKTTKSIYMYPSPIRSHRRADIAVHTVGLSFILIAGTLLILKATSTLSIRTFLRRIDHAAIYTSITGTFTPLLVQAGTTRTFIILALCWALALVAIWNKITNPEIKSKWSTASYLALGAIGLLALPDLKNVPSETPKLILAGSSAYAIGTIFYARKTLPFRYAIWHGWVTLGGMLMFAGIWLALF
jgi:hemolysin III